jgi:superfamily II DNA/RNA helicase
VDGIPLVIRADPPAEHKAYLHRSGRTARVGAAGVVIKVQTSVQAADVRALMGRAGVVPLATRVSPGSALLAAPRAASETALTARPATGRGAVAMSVGYRGRRRR